jgi:hypothetical protein
MELDEARRQLASLQDQLARASARDPEQEVRGIAVPVLNTIITEVKQALVVSAVAASVGDVVTEQLISGEAVRAVDALVVVSALLEASPSPPPARRRFPPVA